MDLSFKEKSAWISFFSTLGIFGYYFLQIADLSGQPLEEAKEQAISLLGQAIVLSIIVEAVFHGMLAATNHKAAEMGADERDKLIEWKANNFGYTVLVVGVLFTLGHIITLEFNPEFAEHSSMQIPMLSAHILMFSFILSEIVRFGSQILLYRKGY